MSEMLKLNLQLFADGDGGGESSGESDGGNPGLLEDEVVDARIPERARKNYADAVKKNRQAVDSQTTTDTQDEPKSHISYEDLIKTDEYKAEHKAYMDKTLGDRLKGVKAENKSMRDALAIVANKYGLDPTSEDFLSSLQGKLNEDNSFYEDYAMEHNISPEDAREILTLKQQARVQEQERQRAEAEQKQNEFIRALQLKADATKAVYPNFDLNTELQNPMFRNLLAATQGDTTAAYRTIHHEELARMQGLQASQRATQQVANAVAMNKSRPIENGLSSQASSITKTDWSKASLSEIRKYAEEQRRLGKRV